MWTCSFCNRSFNLQNQHHYCGDETVAHFLRGKSETALILFDQLISSFEEIGPIKLHATKSMIVISSNKGFAYITQFGKNFMDVVMPFKELYEDNLCFRKMVLVPGSDDYNHHLRLMHTNDVNEEVIYYLKKAYANGKNLFP